MLAHGFTVERMVDLVRAGLATATAERRRAGSHGLPTAARTLCKCQFVSFG